MEDSLRFRLAEILTGTEEDCPTIRDQIPIPIPTEIPSNDLDQVEDRQDLPEETQTEEAEAEAQEGADREGDLILGTQKINREEEIQEANHLGDQEDKPGDKMTTNLDNLNLAIKFRRTVFLNLTGQTTNSWSTS